MEAAPPGKIFSIFTIGCTLDSIPPEMLMPSQREEITESYDLMALVQYIYKSFLYFSRFYTLVHEGKLDFNYTGLVKINCIVYVMCIVNVSLFRVWMDSVLLFWANYCHLQVREKRKHIYISK